MFLANLKQTISRQLHLIAFEILFLSTTGLLIFNAGMGQEKSNFLLLSVLYLLTLFIFSSELIKKAYANSHLLSQKLTKDDN